MAEISKIVLPSGIEYDLKDAQAREGISNVYTKTEIDEKLGDIETVLASVVEVTTTT